MSIKKCQEKNDAVVFVGAFKSAPQKHLKPNNHSYDVSLRTNFLVRATQTNLTPANGRKIDQITKEVAPQPRIRTNTSTYVRNVPSPTHAMDAR